MYVFVIHFLRFFGDWSLVNSWVPDGISDNGFDNSENNQNLKNTFLYKKTKADKERRKYENVHVKSTISIFLN